MVLNIAPGAGVTEPGKAPRLPMFDLSHYLFLLPPEHPIVGSRRVFGGGLLGVALEEELYFEPSIVGNIYVRGVFVRHEPRLRTCAVNAFDGELLMSHDRDMENNRLPPSKCLQTRLFRCWMAGCLGESPEARSQALDVLQHPVYQPRGCPL